jgi:hypothetical protein
MLARTHKDDHYLGAVLDTVAARSVIGHAQAHAYCTAHKISLDLRPSSASFRFADQVCKSLGSFIILIPTLSEPLQLKLDFAQPDVPPLPQFPNKPRIERSCCHIRTGTGLVWMEISVIATTWPLGPKLVTSTCHLVPSRTASPPAQASSPPQYF